MARYLTWKLHHQTMETSMVIKQYKLTINKPRKSWNNSKFMNNLEKIWI